MRFEILARDPATRARVGRIHTPHGSFETPAFMPVGSKGAVKTLAPRDLREIGVDILLSNAYHLALRPGEVLIQKLGGLHRFMSWNGSILTDSGGYQVFSLAKLRRVNETGVTFQSHLDGSTVILTPERAVDIQFCLGSDILMPLDQPVAYPCAYDAAAEAMDRTHRWLKRSRDRWGQTAQDGIALFGIVQGGLFEDLRRRSVEAVLESELPGVAIGGLSIGEPSELTTAATEWVTSLVPEAIPRYLMGVGTPSDILRAVASGVDLFDCILPTRLARNGWAFTSQGMVKVRNRGCAEDEGPLDPACDCFVCQGFSRAYLRHGFKIEEILILKLLSYHNLWYYIRLMRRIREAIRAGTLEHYSSLRSSS